MKMYSRTKMAIYGKNGLSVKDVADSGKYYWYKVTATNHTTAIGSFQV